VAYRHIVCIAIFSFSRNLVRLVYVSNTTLFRTPFFLTFFHIVRNIGNVSERNFRFKTVLNFNSYE
jgi:hypothetical protein